MLKSKMLKFDGVKTETVPFDSTKSFSIMDKINRPIRPGQVSTLTKSVQKMGVIRPIVVAMLSFIDGVNRIYIVDGQHLFTVCIRLSLPIWYVRIKVIDQQDLVEKIALLNSSSVSWTLADYIKAWSSLDEKEDYRKLIKYKGIYDQTYEALAMIFSATERTAGSKRIKNGSFKIINEEKGVEILNDLNDVFANINRGNGVEIRTFVSKYAKWRYITPTYNHKKFVAYVNKNANFVDALNAAGEESEKFFERFK